MMLLDMARYRIKEVKKELNLERIKNVALHDLLYRVIIENSELKRRL